MKIEMDSKIKEIIGYNKAYADVGAILHISDFMKNLYLATIGSASDEGSDKANSVLMYINLSAFANNYAGSERNVAAYSLLTTLYKGDVTIIYHWCLSWLGMMADQERIGQYDLRDKTGCVLASTFMSELSKSVDVATVAKSDCRFDYIVYNSFHRTLRNTVTQVVFLMLGIISVLELVDEDTSCVKSVLCEISGESDLCNMIKSFKRFALV